MTLPPNFMTFYGQNLKRDQNIPLTDDSVENYFVQRVMYKKKNTQKTCMPNKAQTPCFYHSALDLPVSERSQWCTKINTKQAPYAASSGKMFMRPKMRVR